MSFFKEVKPDLADEEQCYKDKEQYYKEIYLEGLWEKFCFTNNPIDLALFVRWGGDIDNQRKRDIISDILETAPFRNPGGSKPIENIEFYLAVLHLMIIGEKLADTNDESKEDPNLSEHFSRFKKLGKTAAIKHVAEKTNISVSAGRDRYREGEKLLGG